MQIPVLGLDPSLRHWGMAEAILCLDTGVLSTPVLSLVEPKDLVGKQVRQNSTDLWLAEQLTTGVMPLAQRAKCIFVECPVGSQSARAMASYGICIGVLGAIRSTGIPLIEVYSGEVKRVFTGKKDASKELMIRTAMTLYPEAVFPMHRGGVANKAEHVADAIASIHAGVQTPVFQNLMRLFAKV